MRYSPAKDPPVVQMFARFLRNLPIFKGKARLARLLLGNMGITFIGSTLKGRQGINYFIPNSFDTIGFFILIDGIYEKKVSDHIAKNIPGGGTFLDIGINIGAISLPVAARRKDIKIIGIEAAAEVCKILERNIGLNGFTNLTVLNRVLADTDGEMIPFYSSLDRFGKGSMSPVFSKSAKLVESLTIDKLMEDAALSYVDIIKADVEGYESVVFKGGKSLLSRTGAPDIIFEFADWAEGLVKGARVGDSQRILLSYGYQLFEFGKLKKGPLNHIVEKGSMLIYASKKPLHQVKQLQ